MHPPSATLRCQFTEHEDQIREHQGYQDDRYRLSRFSPRSTHLFEASEVYTTPMLTVPDAAKRVSRSPETVRRWIRSGRLRAQKVGTQHMIDEEDLESVSGGPLPLPTPWMVTATGEPMPDVVEAVRRSRLSH